MQKPNGKTQPEAPLATLRSAVLALSQARNKAERMHRVKAAFERIEAVEHVLGRVSEELGYVLNVMRDVTGGKYQQLTFTPPPGTKRMRIVDAEDKPVAIVSPSRLCVLIEPKHVQPISLILVGADDAETRVTITQ